MDDLIALAANGLDKFPGIKPLSFKRPPLGTDDPAVFHPTRGILFKLVFPVGRDAAGAENLDT